MSREIIFKEDALNVIRSFINELRPETTGSIVDIYDAVSKIESAKKDIYRCDMCSAAECALDKDIPCCHKWRPENHGKNS